MAELAVLFAGSSIIVYFLIFTLKTIEVAVAVIRIILLTKGNKIFASFISFFEVLLWIFLVSVVLIGIQENPTKAIIYALAFALGQYVGSVIEENMGIGSVRVEVIVLREHEKNLSKILRDQGYAITVFDAQGMNKPRSMLMFYVPRKKIKNLIAEIKIEQENSVITIEDVKPIHGGYRRFSTRKK